VYRYLFLFCVGSSEGEKLSVANIEKVIGNCLVFSQLCDNIFPIYSKDKDGNISINN
jgi:hypothetical protein